MTAHVLAAEDSPTQAAVLRGALERAGFSVTMTRTGGAALRRLDEGDVDIVVSDVMMPEMDGYELCRRIKADARHVNVPVLLLTSLGDPVDIVRGLEAGADSFLTKPFDPEQLVGRIRSLLESRELQASGRFRIGVDVLFMGHRFAVTGERQQILDVLMSSFEDLVHANERLRDREAELARAEAELAEQLSSSRASRDRLNRVLQDSGVAAWEFDMSTMRLSWWENLEQAFGLQGEFEGTLDVLLDRVHPDDLEPFVDLIGRWFTAWERDGDLSSIDRQEAEYRILLPGGEQRCLSSTALVTDPDAGRTAGVLVDVTDRHAAESEVRRQAKLIEAIIETSPDAIVLFDRDGRYAYASPAIAELTGYPPEEFVGRHPGELQTVVGGSTRIEAFEQLAAGEMESFKARYPLTRRDGRIIEVEHHGRPLRDDSGAPTGAVVVKRDVTQQAELQRESARAREEAEAANLAKSEFLSRMSHELRTPLNAILGFGQLLAMGDGLDPDDVEAVGHILSSGKHLLRLIDEVLDISRIESGRMTISVEPVDASEVIAGSIDLVRSLADDHDVSLDVESGEPLYVLADRGRLKQILVNLLSNGVKYNHAGGRVTVSCSPAGDGDVQIQVADTGPGIRGENLDRLFAPFDRLGAEQTATEGTGLGLSLSRNLAEAMSGTLEVETALGEGSTFTVLLPVAERPTEPAVSEASSAAGPEPSSIQGTVVYIEDNPSNLRLVERVLDRRPGTQLITAEDAELGLELIRQHRPDLVLLDLNLPGTYGGEVLGLLRDDPATRSIPVVIVSADAAPQRAEELLAAGATGYLTKPLDVDELLKLIDENLSQENR